MLYVVATPIGNLSDITYRAIEVLKHCDYILCEDTRHSKILLRHYDIDRPLKSFHKFSEASKQRQILDDLSKGVAICLISDAGTPGISDPGSQLVKSCVEEGIRVVPIPGPCAAIAALCCSGLDTALFQFVGFLPKKAGDLKRLLHEILEYSGTTVCYESPNRLVDVLILIQELAPERRLAVARELTKKFEEIKPGCAADLLTYWKQSPLKGEIILMIAGKEQESKEWSAMTPQQHVDWLQKEYGLSRKEAIVSAAKLRGVSKRDVYNAVHAESSEKRSPKIVEEA